MNFNISHYRHKMFAIYNKFNYMYIYGSDSSPGSSEDRIIRIISILRNFI